MFNMGSAPSLSDIAAVTKDGNGDGWGNGNGWWVLIILFAIFGGWGNGWGGQGRNGEDWKNDISHHRPKPCNYFHVEELIWCTPYESSYP